MGWISKGLVPGLMFVLMTFLVTSQKVSFVWTLRVLRKSDLSLETGYLAIALLVLAPYLFSLIQLFWNISYLTKSTTPQLPHWKDMLLGVFLSIVEGTSVVVFTIEVAALLPVYILLPLLNAVFAIPMLQDLISRNKSKEYTIEGGKPEDDVIELDAVSPCPKTCSCVVSLITLFLPGLLACVLYFTGLITWFQAACLGITLFCLSVVWSPKIQVQVLTTKYGMEHVPRRIQGIYVLVKVMSIVACFLIYIKLSYANQTYTFVYNQFKQRLPSLADWDILLPLLLNFSSGLFSHGLSYAAVGLCLPMAGICLPVILSTLAAIAFCTVYLAPYVYFVDELRAFGPMIPLLAAAGISALAWAIPFLVKCSEFVEKPKLLNVPFEVMFLNYGWNSVFFDQHLFLSYRADGFGRIPRTKLFAKQSRSMVFVCTTMYHEADYEMERILLSIQRLSDSEKLNNVRLEAHVFMDNGCDGLVLKEFAQQLVSLISDKLECKVHDASRFESPYGIQIGWTLRGGLPLFIHLKDPKKVKAKKRWSQAMYIHYMMRYRTKMLSERERKSMGDQKDKGNQLFVGYSSELEWKKNAQLIQYLNPGYIEDSDAREKKDELAGGIDKLGYQTMVDLHHTPIGDNADKQESDDQGLGSTASDETASSVSGSTGRETECETEKGSTSDSCPPHSSTDDGIVNEGFEADDSSSEESTKTFPNDAIGSDMRKPLTDKLASVERKRTRQKSGSGERNGKRSTEGKDTALEGVLPKQSSAAAKSDGLSEVWLGVKQPIACPVVDPVSAGSIQFEDPIWSDDQTYILATDADMEFKPEAVLELINLCNWDKRLGGACGRTHPIGKKNGPIVWHQIFEYAKDFWMIKNAQNVIGSVMCAPGCFSLYRATAIKQVMAKYSKPTLTPFTVYVKDTGEDRWMATLMMINGWKLRYSSFAHNTTYCPDTFDEFLKQRRRWVLSDVANALLVVQNIKRLIRNNECFTFVYVAYLLNMFLNNIITPGSAIVMITAGMDLVFNVPYIYTTVPLAVVVLVYSIFCTRASVRAQTLFTIALTAIMGCTFFAIVVWGSTSIIMGIVQDIIAKDLKFQQHYIILMLTISLVYSAVFHPREAYMIIYGMAYVFIFPAMHILLPIYAVCNIVDQSWGTRDSNVAKKPAVPCIFSCFIRRRKNKKSSKSLDGAGEDQSVSDSFAEEVKPMEDGNEEERKEFEFWKHLKGTLLGNDVNTGLGKVELAERLRVMRNRCTIGLMIINLSWLCILSVFYIGISSPLSRLNIYGLIAGALYGFTLTIQVIGLTACRLDFLFRKLAHSLYGDERPMWVSQKVN